MSPVIFCIALMVTHVFGSRLRDGLVGGYRGSKFSVVCRTDFPKPQGAMSGQRWHTHYILDQNHASYIGPQKNWDLGRMIIVNGDRARHPKDYKPMAYIPYNHRNGSDEILSHETLVQLQMEHNWADDKDAYLGYRGKTKRKFVWPKGSTYLWPKGIVLYKFATGDRAFTKQYSYTTVRRAMDWYEERSCIVFKMKDAASVAEAGHDHYIEIGTGKGCAAYLGRGSSRKPVREVYLHESYCMTFSTVLHELGHSLGMHHEQSRSDRDQYVTMQWQYIPEPKGNSVNWGKVDTSNYAPYDLGSNMQYSLYAGSKKRGKMTMIPKDADLTFLATSRRPGVMSFYDMEALNYAYGCADTCANKPICKNGGYVNHECVCVCPEDLTGALCETVITSSGCGGVIRLNRGQSENVHSPSFPANYSIGADCGWLVEGPNGSYVEFELVAFDIPLTSGDECGNALEVRYNLIGQPGPRYCGKDWNRGVFNTTKDRPSNIMMIRFSAPISGVVGQGFSGRVYVSGFSCDPNPCLNGGTCSVSHSGSVECACPPGVTGDRCETNMCDMRNCQNGGTCQVDENGTEVCECPDGVFGAFCENVACSPNPCQNGGTCDWTDDGREKCACPKGVFGNRCQLNDCVSNPCKNGGNCIQKNAGSVKCICTDGFHGDFCEDIVKQLIKCDFDVIKKCPLSQDPRFGLRWRVRRRKTPTSRTGPKSAYGGKGKYAYIEASRVRPGTRARLLTEPLVGAEYRCVRFYYHMYGSQMGKLAVNMRVNGKDMQLWAREKDQGNRWHFAELALRSTSAYQLVFEATRGRGSRSDIAIDQLSISPERCHTTATTPATSAGSTRQPTTTINLGTPNPVKDNVLCDFDKETLCHFTNARPKSGLFAWKLHRGPTPSKDTGPTSDHSGNGHYLLMEASEPRMIGDRAIITSPMLRHASCASSCLTFWYHSRGETAGRLSVQKVWREHNSNVLYRAGLWSSPRSVSPFWRRVDVTVAHAGPFQVQFVAVVNGWQGDIGLDDISMTDGPCSARG